MLYRISLFIRRFATGKNVLLSVALFMVFQVILGYFSTQIKAESQNAGVMDLGFAYTPEEVYTRYLDHYTEKGIALYKIAECVDLVYPMVYAIMLSLMLTWGFSGIISPDSPWRLVNVLPFVGADLDYLENIGVFSFLFTHPEKWMFMATWTTVFGTLKWLVVAPAILLGLVAVLMRLLGKKSV